MPSLFLQNSSISHIHKKEIISPTGLILSFSDWGCFILEFDILKSTISRKIWDQYDATYKTIMFPYVANLVLICSKSACHKKFGMVRPGSSAWQSHDL